MEDLLKKLLEERKNITIQNEVDNYHKCKDGHPIKPWEFNCQICHLKYMSNQCFGMWDNYQPATK